MMPAAWDGTETMRMMETTMQVHERPEERKMTMRLPSVIQKTRVRGGGVAVCSMPSVPLPFRYSDLLNARGNWMRLDAVRSLAVMLTAMMQ